MLETYYRNICSHKDVRENLIALKKCLAEEKAKRQLAYMLAGDFDTFYRLLGDEDPKIRKNAALILGQMETEDVLPALFSAWHKEETRFIRCDYLKAAEKLDYKRYLPALEERARALEAEEVTEQTAKHVREELAQIRKMLLTYARKAKHVFAVDRLPVCLVTANKTVLENLERQLDGEDKKIVGGALRVSGASWAQLREIRYWSELLLLIPGIAALKGTPVQAAQRLGDADLAEFLDDLHEGNGQWRYRVEIRAREKDFDKGAWIRRFSAELDRCSKGALINSAGDYELELRLVQRKDGGFLPFIKLFTVEDERFRYRSEMIPDSMTPVQAALCMELARPYLRESAQVLDPFCGAGTLLTERSYAGDCGSMYGTDIYGAAIDKARDNAAHARMSINYIHRDFYTFTHEYLFDELITDLPRQGFEAGRFVGKLQELMAKDGLLVLYSIGMEKTMKELAAGDRLQTLAKYVINEKKEIQLWIFRCRI